MLSISPDTSKQTNTQFPGSGQTKSSEQSYFLKDWGGNIVVRLSKRKQRVSLPWCDTNLSRCRTAGSCRCCSRSSYRPRTERPSDCPGWSISPPLSWTSLGNLTATPPHCQSPAQSRQGEISWEDCCCSVWKIWAFSWTESLKHLLTHVSTFHQGVRESPRNISTYKVVYFYPKKCLLTENLTR